MAGLEEQLNAVLSNPQMMQQIMAMAQNFQSPQEAPPIPPPPVPTLPAFDPAMLQKLSGLMTQGGIDKNQQQLLSALGAYINPHRVNKLEKAMQAAKMAKLATGLLGNLGQGR